MEDLVSIIVPIYNTEKYLKDCIKSVQVQTYSNWELILIDDGSKDNSLQICEEFAHEDNRIKVFHQENAGVSRARNLGLNKSTGIWISFLDSDDLLDKEHISTCIRFAKENNLDIVKFELGGNYFNSKSNSNKQTVLAVSEFIDNPNCKLCIPSFLNKKIIEDTRFNESIKYAEDQLFNYILLSKVEQIGYIFKPLYYYRYNDSSATKKTDGYARLLACKQICYLKSNPIFRQRINDSILSLIIESCIDNKITISDIRSTINDCKVSKPKNATKSDKIFYFAQKLSTRFAVLTYRLWYKFRTKQNK